MNGTKTSTKKEWLKERAPYIIMSIAVAFVIVLAFGHAYADPLEDVFGIIKKIGAIICYVLGGIYLILGIVRFAQAHADENGMQEKKAANTLATAIILLIVGTVVLVFPLDSIMGLINDAKG